MIHLDEQALAYREMTDTDLVRDPDIPAHASWVHEPLPPAAAPRDFLLLPEDYERDAWDTGRTDLRPSGGAG